MKCSLGISNFLEEISSLCHSVGFLYFFALIMEEGFLISSCYSLELCIQMLISFLFSFAFRVFFSQLFVRPPQTAILPRCISFLRDGFGCCLLHNVINLHPWSMCLSDLIPWIYLSPPLYYHKGFDLGHTWMVSWFSLLSSICLNFAIRSSWFRIWVTVSSCFCWLSRASPSLAAKIIISPISILTFWHCPCVE